MPSNSIFVPNSGNRNLNGDLLYGLIVQRALLAQAITVGVSAVKMPTTPLGFRKNIIIFNNSSNAIYLGDSTVTTSSGLPLYPRASVNIQIEDKIDVYAISTVADNDIRILEGS